MAGAEATRLMRLTVVDETNEYTLQSPMDNLLHNNRFGITMAPEQQQQIQTSPVASMAPNIDTSRTTLGSPPSSEEYSDASEEGDLSSSGITAEETDFVDDSNATTPTAGSTWKTSSQPGRRPLKYPTLSRAFSMPLPSQLNHLQNPHRPSSSELSSTPTALTRVSVARNAHHLHELSLELADSVQTVIQTMLQVSPNQILDPAKEQFSACSLSIPTPSMSAMLTAMKNLNYISANMAHFCADVSSMTDTELMTPHPPSMNSPTDFDIGEMLQSVGDALSGAAAHTGVDLVLYHGDVGIKHLGVRGDETGISYALSHVIRQVLNTAQHGDSLELGLFIQTDRSRRQDGTITGEPEDFGRRASSPVDLDAPLHCTIEIGHKFTVPEATTPSGEEAFLPVREEPSFSSILLRRLLNQVGATVTQLNTSSGLGIGRSIQFAITLLPGIVPSPVTAAPDASPDSRVSNEPTLDELTHFIAQLRGKKVTLYASSKGSFARHLSSYLTAWGLEISHVSAETGLEENAAYAPTSPNPSISVESPTPSDVPQPPSLERYPTVTGVPTAATSEAIPNPIPRTSFVMIDDNISVLKERLQEARSYGPPIKPLKRPVNPHRPRSTSHMTSLRQMPQPPPAPLPAVIVHFTSLANYKAVRDVIQSSLSSAWSQATLPEVLIIPKPAGPRRFLTALHTAVTRPVVDPFFIPIATSPMSPGLHAGHSFFQNVSPRSPHQRPTTSRSPSDRSQRSPKDMHDHSHQPPPPSPLGNPDNVEYFSDAAAVKLGSSPSSGFMIQSPDGQPAGIFFHPKPSRSRGGSPAGNTGVNMGRDDPRLVRRGSVSRRTAEVNSPQSFAALHPTSSPPVQYQTPLPLMEPAKAAKKLALSPGGATSPEQSKLPSPNPPATRRSSTQDSVPSKPGPSSEPTVAPPRKARRVPTADGRPSGHLLGKGKQAGDDIVPPVSVLIVEDNPINQTILATYIRKKKIRYDVAKNGLEAVQKWKTGGFHIIFMDIQMPVMDGIAATKEIRRLELQNAQAGYLLGTPQTEECRTPSGSENSNIGSPYRSSVIIVALTASSMESDRVAALAAGCNDFLTKPVALDWLNNKIIEWGSIKALQTWADMRQDAVRTLANGQSANAERVANRLHVPRERQTPPPGLNRPHRLSPPPLTGPEQSLAASSTAATNLTSPLSPQSVQTPTGNPPSASQDNSLAEEPTLDKSDAPQSDAPVPNEAGEAPQPPEGEPRSLV